MLNELNLELSRRSSSAPFVLANLSCRPLTAEDSISALTKLLHLSYRPLAEQGMRYLASHQDESKTLERAAKGECYVALLDGNVVGTVTLSDIEKTKGSSWYDRPDVASFGQFAVHPEYQGFGIGSKLMDLIEMRARQKGIAELALDTSEHAAHLIKMYQKRGYRFIEYVQWEITNYRSVILSKSLDSVSS